MIPATVRLLVVRIFPQPTPDRTEVIVAADFGVVNCKFQLFLLTITQRHDWGQNDNIVAPFRHMVNLFAVQVHMHLSKEQPVLATDHELTQRPLRNIIVDSQTTVRAISPQRRLIAHL